MTEGLILFFVGIIFAGVTLRLIESNTDKLDKFKRQKTIFVIVNIVMAACVLVALIGLVIVFTHIWWLSLLLFFFAMPFVVKSIAGEK